MIWTLMLFGLVAFVAAVYLGIIVWLWLVERDRRRQQEQDTTDGSHRP